MTAKKLVKRQNHKKRKVESWDGDVKEKLQVVLKVSVSDAIVNPGAVVVHSKNAVATIAAVIGSWGLPGVSVSAIARITTGLNSNVFWLKRRFHSLFYPSRVCKSCPLVANNCHQAAHVKCEEVISAPSVEGQPLNPLVHNCVLVVPIENRELVGHELTEKN